MFQEITLTYILICAAINGMYHIKIFGKYEPKRGDGGYGFKATFNTISAISWCSILLVEETEYSEETTDLSRINIWWYIDWLTFNENFSSISAISWRKQVLYTNFYNYSTLRYKLDLCIKNHKIKNTVIKALFKNQWLCLPAAGYKTTWTEQLGICI